ncbi:hypothetical protein HF577_26515, partial [Pseudonocardia xinjiangensis]
MSQRWAVVIATLAIFGWAAVSVGMLLRRPGSSLGTRTRIAAASVTAAVGIGALVAAWTLTGTPAAFLAAGPPPPPRAPATPPRAAAPAAPTAAAGST